MNTQLWRIVGAVTGFAFAAVWIGAGFLAALACVAAAAAGVAAVTFAERQSVEELRQRVLGLRRLRLPTQVQKPKVHLRRERVRVPDWPSQESTYGW